MILRKRRICVTLLVLFIVLYVDAQQEPAITKNILPEIKRYGTAGILNCTVARQGPYKVHWRSSGSDSNRNIHISTDDKIVIEDINNRVVDLGKRKYDIHKIVHAPDLSTYQLIIRRLSKDDAGVYTCTIQITGGSNTPDPQKDGEMVVLIPPSIDLLSSSQTVNVREGSDVTLHCNADGYPKPNVTWVRPNGMTLPQPYDRQFSVKNNTITLRNLNETDRGVYRCLADNNVRPPAVFDVTLYVQFRPFARAVQSSYGQAQNRMFDVTMECRISGNPTPDLRWWKDGEEIADDDFHVIHVLLSHGQTLSLMEFWYQLTIINVRANDYGIYYCEGTNLLGSHNASIELYETSECQGSRCLFLGGSSAASLTSLSMCMYFVTAMATLLVSCRRNML